MRTKTAALTAAGALALSALGGVAFASPLLTDNTPSVSADGTDGTAGTDDTADTDDTAAVIADELTGLVQDGTLTQEQADQVATTLSESMPGKGMGLAPGKSKVHGGAMGHSGGMGNGRGAHGAGRGHGADDGHGPGLRGGMGSWHVIEETLETAASTLGLPQDALVTELRAGKTLGEIADAEGVDRATLVGDLVTTLTSETAERVADGTLSQEQADAITAELDQRVTEALDRQLPGGHGGPKGADDEGDS